MLSVLENELDGTIEDENGATLSFGNFDRSRPNSSLSSLSTSTLSSPVVLKGYLDDLSSDLYKKDEVIDEVADSREANQMNSEQLDRYGPGNLDQYVEFEEFDGGDGQMGVAGDGNKGLDKSEFETGALASSMNKSRARSAKNAWGTSTGYAEELIAKTGMDSARAQQLENWHQQREIQARKQQQKYMTEQFDQVSQNAEADWRTLAKFGVERNQEFDLNEAFGTASIEGGEMAGEISVQARPGGIGYQEFLLRNPYMGFADFRATFTPGTSAEWTVEPKEGALKQREDTQFSVKFRPNGIGVSEGYLVIETEDFKKVWKLTGST